MRDQCYLWCREDVRAAIGGHHFFLGFSQFGSLRPLSRNNWFGRKIKLIPDDEISYMALRYTTRIMQKKKLVYFRRFGVNEPRDSENKITKIIRYALDRTMLRRGIPSLSISRVWATRTNACYDRGIPFFGYFSFWMIKIVGNWTFLFLQDSCGVSPWDCSSGVVVVAVLFFSKPVFGRGP